MAASSGQQSCGLVQAAGLHMLHVAGSLHESTPLRASISAAAVPTAPRPTMATAFSRIRSNCSTEPLACRATSLPCTLEGTGARHMEPPAPHERFGGGVSADSLLAVDAAGMAMLLSAASNAIFIRSESLVIPALSCTQSEQLLDHGCSQSYIRCKARLEALHMHA